MRERRATDSFKPRIKKSKFQRFISRLNQQTGENYKTLLFYKVRKAKTYLTSIASKLNFKFIYGQYRRIVGNLPIVEETEALTKP